MEFKWSKHVRLSNGRVFKWWSENWTKMSIYVLKCSVFEWSAQSPFKNQTKKCLKSRMFKYQVFGIQMVAVVCFTSTFPHCSKCCFNTVSSALKDKFLMINRALFFFAYSISSCRNNSITFYKLVTLVGQPRYGAAMIAIMAPFDYHNWDELKQVQGLLTAFKDGRSKHLLFVNVENYFDLLL